MLNTHEAVCRSGSAVTDVALMAELGDGDDSVTIESSPVEVAPGLTGELGLEGTAVLRGGSGNDAIVGNEEPDEIDGGVGSDRIDGGRGDGDVLHYNDRTRSLYVDLLHGMGGEPGEMDQVSDIEIVEGGRAGDTMIANPRASAHEGDYGRLDGGPGDDHLTGSRCSDWLTGQDGNDVLEGRGGGDFLRGDSAVLRDNFFNCRSRRRGRDDNDRVSGGPGRDLLCESSGHNHLRGGPGADWLKGGGNRDSFRPDPVTTASTPATGSRRGLTVGQDGTVQR